MSTSKGGPARQTENAATRHLISGLSDEISEMSAQYAHASGEDSKEEVGELLIGTLDDSDPFVRLAATEALINLGQIVIPSLIHSINADHSSTRKMIVLVLGCIGDKRTFEQVATAFNDESAEVRRNAVVAVSKIDPNRAISLIVEALKDENNYVRQTAAGCLHDIGDESCVKPLILALSDVDAEVRYNATIALSRIGSIQALDFLQFVAQNDMGETSSGHIVKKAAIEAIKQIKDKQAEQLIR